MARIEQEQKEKGKKTLRHSGPFPICHDVLFSNAMRPCNPRAIVRGAPRQGRQAGRQVGSVRAVLRLVALLACLPACLPSRGWPTAARTRERYLVIGCLPAIQSKINKSVGKLGST